VAELVSSSERTVNDWERDVSSPKAAVLAALAAHGLDVRYIVTGSRDYAPPEPLSSEEQVLLSHWRAASRPVRTAALAVLLSDSAAQRPRTEMNFNAGVNQVVHGDSNISAGRFVMQAPGVYPVKSRKASKKAPGKP
jgi:transcriptional regulator with XRE-family HTH domain